MFEYSMVVENLIFSKKKIINAEIQPIVSSKQPIVFTLSALGKSFFNL